MLPEGFVLRMKKLLVAEFDAFAASYDRLRNVGLRRNPQKGAQLALPEFGLTPVPWCADGFYYDAAARPGLRRLQRADEPGGVDALRLRRRAFKLHRDHSPPPFSLYFQK